MDVKYDISLDKSLVKDCVRCILSTILFHRIFGAVIPQTREVLGISYPCIVSAEMDSLIEENLSVLLRTIESSHRGTPFQTSPMGSPGRQVLEVESITDSSHESTTPNGSQIGIQFFEKRPKKSSWFSKGEEEICWEQWIITITVEGRTEDLEASRQRAIDQLREILLSIVTKVNNHKSHIPPITTTDANPFPYQIVVPAVSGETWASVFRKILE